jgi:uncharacterized protein YycO
MDRVIEWFEVGWASHAALCDGDGNVIEARLHGIAVRPESEYATDGVAYRALNSTPEQAARAVKFARSLVGTPYGFKDVLVDGLRYLLHINAPKLAGRHLDCSCLVNEAWKAGGITLTRRQVPSPADLAASPFLVKL